MCVVKLDYSLDVCRLIRGSHNEDLKLKKIMKFSSLFSYVTYYNVCNNFENIKFLNVVIHLHPLLYQLFLLDLIQTQVQTTT